MFIISRRAHLGHEKVKFIASDVRSGRRTDVPAKTAHVVWQIRKTAPVREMRWPWQPFQLSCKDFTCKIHMNMQLCDALQPLRRTACELGNQCLSERDMLLLQSSPKTLRGSLIPGEWAIVAREA